MKAFFVVLPAMFFATTCFAQNHSGSNPAGTLNGAPYNYIQTFTQVNEGVAPFYPTHDTPTMQRQRLVLAVALRNEAHQLQQQNGGTLTAEHRRYLRRAAYKIVNGSR